MFSNIKFYQKKCKRIYLWFHNNYESFLTLIKDCPHPNDICLNSNYYCFNKQSFKIIVKTRYECECSGKYNQICKSGYCATDK